MLLIDNDDGFRSGLADNLRDDGHNVYEYSAPRDVPPLTSLGEVSLVITDCHFADDDGVRFCDQVHDSHPTLPIVMITAYQSSHLDAVTASHDHLHLLRKPLSYEMLHALVHWLIDARRGMSPRMHTA